jgi:GAF domain-containing protein
MLDESANEIELMYSIDRGNRYPSQRIPSQRGLSGYVISSGKSLIIHDLDREGSQYDLIHFGEESHVLSAVVAPMRLGNKIFGLISAQSYQMDTYTAEDLHLLEILAAYAAIALDNSRLFTQIQASNVELDVAYEEMIRGWSRALEMRDKETKGHSGQHFAQAQLADRGRVDFHVIRKRSVTR